MTGPRSDPPMPMLTTSVIGLPVDPLQLPSRTLSENCCIFVSTPLIAGMTSSPSTRTGVFERFRKAICSTALSSVQLIFSPENILVACSVTPEAAARSRRRDRVSPVTIFFEKSSSMPKSSSRIDISSNLESCPKSSRRWMPFSSSACDLSASHWVDRVNLLTACSSHRAD